jgi:hypothetical protein
LLDTYGKRNELIPELAEVAKVDNKKDKAKS